MHKIYLSHPSGNSLKACLAKLNCDLVPEIVTYLQEDQHIKLNKLFTFNLLFRFCCLQFINLLSTKSYPILMQEIGDLQMADSTFCGIRRGIAVEPVYGT